ITARQFLPFTLTGKVHWYRLFYIRRRPLDRKVRRFVLVFRAHGVLGLDVRVGFAGFAIFLIGQPPQRTRKCIGVVADGKLSRRDARAAVASVGIVEAWIADAHGDIGHATARAGRGKNRALRAYDGEAFAVGHTVAGEISGRILPGELRVRAMQYLLL